MLKCFTLLKLQITSFYRVSLVLTSSLLLAIRNVIIRLPSSKTGTSLSSLFTKGPVHCLTSTWKSLKCHHEGEIEQRQLHSSWFVNLDALRGFKEKMLYPFIDAEAIMSSFYRAFSTLEASKKRRISMASHTTIFLSTIPQLPKESILDGNNHLDWELQIRTLLQYHCLWNVVNGSEKKLPVTSSSSTTSVAGSS